MTVARHRFAPRDGVTELRELIQAHRDRATDLGKREVEAHVDDGSEEEQEEEADYEERFLQHRQPVERVVQLQTDNISNCQPRSTRQRHTNVGIHTSILHELNTADLKK